MALHSQYTDSPREKQILAAAASLQAEVKRRDEWYGLDNWPYEDVAEWVLDAVDALQSSPQLSDVLTPLRDYLEHGSWRCSDGARYPRSEWASRGDCHCGFVRALVAAGCSLPEALHIAGKDCAS